MTKETYNHQEAEEIYNSARQNFLESQKLREDEIIFRQKLASLGFNATSIEEEVCEARSKGS